MNITETMYLRMIFIAENLRWLFNAFELVRKPNGLVNACSANIFSITTNKYLEKEVSGSL